MGKIRETFYTAEDFLEFCTKTPRTQDFRDGYVRPEWYGLENEMEGDTCEFRVMTRLMREGWENGVNLMSEVESQIELPQARSLKRRRIRSDQGDDVDMQRIYSGNLDTAWSKMKRQFCRGPMRLRIVIDAISIGGVDADDMKWQGVAAMKLTDVLTAAGYSVQVESAFHGKGGRSAQEGDGERDLRVIVKNYSSPLELHTLATTTALPGFFRCLGHTWAGGSMSVPRLQESQVQDPNDPAPVFIADQGIRCASTAAAWVQRTLTELETRLGLIEDTA